MKQTCERTDDLIAVLYGEASEGEKREFQVHLNECLSCRAEYAAFAQIRESIGEWRNEVLTGFVPAQTASAPARKSALAALRQFFDLSPLWMKGAVGFAAVLFCVLAALAVMRLQPVDDVPQVTAFNPDAVYTQKDLDRAVQEALTRQQEALANQQREQEIVAAAPSVGHSSLPKNSTVANTVREPRARRPFSKAEREQLAAELRLLSSQDEENLDLLGDRINK